MSRCGFSIIDAANGDAYDCTLPVGHKGRHGFDSYPSGRDALVEMLRAAEARASAAEAESERLSGLIRDLPCMFVWACRRAGSIRMACSDAGPYETEPIPEHAWRTGISLAQDGGADSRVLRWGTHAPPGETIDAYTTLAWKTLCRAVLMLHVLKEPGAVRASKDTDPS